MNKFIIATCILALLAGCTSPSYIKTEGQVTSKYISNGRYGTYYEVNIAHKTVDGVYVISTIEVDQSDYNTYQSGQNVSIYANDNRIGAILKEDK